VPRQKNAILWAIAVVLSILIALGLVLLLHPVLLMGRYYEFTVKKVDLDDDGMLIITYDESLTYDTEVIWRWRPRMSKAESIRYSWDQKPSGFLRWPRRDRDRTIGFRWSPNQRLLLKEGTYRIRSGEWLQFIETTLPDGKTWPSEISVEPKP
jgi:hypothetical protein